MFWVSSPKPIHLRSSTPASHRFRLSCSEIARSAPAETKERLRAHLLPSDQGRTQVLGRGDSLPHRLVRISTETVSPVLKEVVAHPFLELSDGNGKRLVQNVGFRRRRRPATGS